MKIKKIKNNQFNAIGKYKGKFIIAQAKYIHDDNVEFDESFGKQLAKYKYRIKNSEERIKFYNREAKKYRIQMQHYEKLADEQNQKCISYAYKIDKMIKEKYKN